NEARSERGVAGRRLVQDISAARDDLRLETRAVLLRALLVFEIDVDDAEAFRITVRPLEIVEQRPREVAAHVNARRTGGVNGRNVAAQMVDAQRIRDAIIGCDGRIEKSRAVLGDIDRRIAVA